jgi:hypothetical protein
MLNGFVYYDIVKYFWNKATILDKFNTDEEDKEIKENAILKNFLCKKDNDLM